MPKREVIAKEILAYLLNRPEAEDSLEGMMNWWLRSDKGGHAIDEVRDALDLLIDKGEIEEVKSQQDIFIYKVKKRLKV